MAHVHVMESTYQDLADRALQILEASQKYRILIFLVGAPGSGKTTVANRVKDILNKRHKEQGEIIVEKEKKESVLSRFNDGLPLYDSTLKVDLEDEKHTPTLQKQSNGDHVIRGRGGDSTALKIKNSFQESDEEFTDSFAQVIPMDGFHLPRSVLKQFQNPEEAFERRGSPYTFDSSLVVKLVENLNETIKVPNLDEIAPLDTLTQNSRIPSILIPDFNHAEHDPNQFGCEIHSSSRIIIMEGLYLLLNNPVWCQISRTLQPDVKMGETENGIASSNTIKNSPIAGKNHEFWKIIISPQKILERLGKRHLSAGIAKTLNEAEERVKFNDLPNGEKIYRESFKSDLSITSIDDNNECIY